MYEMITPRGTRDLVGNEAELFEYIVRVFKDIAELNGFKPIITPTIEYFELFEKKSGEEIIRSMYVFKDKAGRRIALRPEITAPIIRAFITKLRALPRPIMVYYVGQCFRYEEPQKGRYREFWQAGVEVIGEPSIEGDLKAINVAEEFLKHINIDHYYIVGNVGIYRKIMKYFNVPDNEQDHILHLIDKGFIDEAIKYSRKFSDKLGEIISILLTTTELSEMPSILQNYVDEKTLNEVSMETSKLEELIDYLKSLNVETIYEPRLVRGLAYYNSVIYEVKVKELKVSIGGGGRYDGLTAVYGTPFEYSTGIALGIDRIMLVLVSKKNNLSIGNRTKKGVMIIILNNDSSAIIKGYQIARKLHSYGIISKVIVGRKIGKALSLANKEGYRYAVIIGSRELSEKMISIKDLEKGLQEKIDVNSLLEYIARNS